MKDNSENPSSFVKMAQARELMDRGRHRESLILALDALLQELNHLKESLLALQTITRPESSATTTPMPEEPPQPEPYWLPAAKPRLLH